MNIVKLCLEEGAGAAEEIPVSKLVFSAELRKLCEADACGRYGRNYTCPPFTGGADDLISKLKSFSKAVVWQNIYFLEDSFDFEGMMKAQKEHNAQTRRIARRIYAGMPREGCVVLAAGGCDLCAECAALSALPCRVPDEALSSLEAYGMVVSKLEDVSSLKYINGADTVTYFSGVFFDPEREGSPAW
jgi:predicted metal-binding protein